MQIPLPDFSKVNVLVVGDLMLDRYWFGDTARISPEAPVPVVKVKQMDDRPGGAGNVALNVAALGAKVAVIGITGNDEAATKLKDQLAAAHVQYDIHQVAHIRTITKLRVISRHQQLLRLDMEDVFPEMDQEHLIHAFQKHLKHAQIVILSDYGKGTLTCSEQLIRIARAAGVPVIVDPKGLDFTIYRGAHIITPNLKEFEAIVGICKNEQEILNKAQHLLKTFEIDNLLLTRGEQGMTLIQKDAEELHLPAHAREVFDVTGAGDTVIAMLGASLAAQRTLPEAMALANLAASLVVAKLGAATISAPELQFALDHQISTVKSGIVNEEQLLHAVLKARAQKKKIVFTNGCFDILHAGHVNYLKQAKQLGDLLIVAINDDGSVKRLKGANRPINSTESRLAVLAGLGVVDCVTSFSDDTPERLLKLLRPDILVKGGDYQIDQVVGADIVMSYGGHIRVLGLTKDISTSLIIDRMIKQHHTSPEDIQS